MGACHSKHDEENSVRSTMPREPDNDINNHSMKPRQVEKTTLASIPESSSTMLSTDTTKPSVKSTRIEKAMREKTMLTSTKVSAFNRPRTSVRATNIDLEKFKSQVFPKTDDERNFLSGVVSKIFFLAACGSEQTSVLVDAMTLEIVPAGGTIIEEGDWGAFFYVIQEGKVGFEVHGKHEGYSYGGSSFGELSLLYNTPRSATCKAETECRLWKVDQCTFQGILSKYNEKQYESATKFIKQIPFLSQFDDAIQRRICNSMLTVDYDVGEVIFRKGDIGDVFYIVRKGTVKVHEIGTGSRNVTMNLGPGEWFGEASLLSNDGRRTASTTAVAKCSLLCLSSKDFERNLGPFQEVMSRSTKRRFLLGVPEIIDSKLRPIEIDRIADDMAEEKFNKGEILMKEGCPSEEKIYIITKGSMQVSRPNGIVNVIKERDSCGTWFLYSGGNNTSPETVTVMEPTTAYTLTKYTIKRVLKNSRRIVKRQGSLPRVIDPSIKLEHLEKHRIVGMGSFSKVWLVSHKKTGTTYALKIMKKEKVIKSNRVAHVIRQKNLICCISHPFIIKLFNTFQCDANLYTLHNFVHGGGLFASVHREDGDSIPEGNAKFYGACVLEALSHLHSNNICYRDLKPESVLIDEHGYCVIIGFTYSKVVLSKTYTLCGTLEYLAPEVILSKGHDKGRDYWAFGVFLYEMLVGYSPFGHIGDEASLLKNIVKVEYDFPEDDVSEDAQNLIKGLLVYREAERLGCILRGDEDIRDAPWFKDIDFDEVFRREMKAPWVPIIDNPLDAIHHDNFSFAEKEDNKTNYLTSQEQRLFEEF